MRYIKYCLTFLLLSAICIPVFSQEDVSANKIDTDKLHSRIDSLSLVLDSVLTETYNIEKKTTKDGHLIHTAIGMKVSSLGIGAELVLSVHAVVNVRLSASYFQHTQTDQLHNESVEADITHENIVGGAYLLVDYQFNKWVHATAGILYKVDKENGTAHPTGGLTIGGIEIPSDVVGQISYAIQNNGVAPYIGAGFGRSISLDKKIAFSADVGVYYYDNQTVEMEATGMLEPTAIQKNTLIENAGNQKFFPFFGIQLTYRIF